MERILLRDYLAACQHRISDFHSIAKEAAIMSSSGRAIEIGGGPAPAFLESLGTQFKGELVGVDIDSKSMKTSSMICHTSSIFRRVNFIVCAGEFLPFVDGAFNLIVSLNSLHHWKDPVKIMNEVNRILASNGHGLVTDFRRDMSREALEFLQRDYRNPLLKYRLRQSVKESYVRDEVDDILERANLGNHKVVLLPNGLMAEFFKP